MNDNNSEAAQLLQQLSLAGPRWTCAASLQTGDWVLLDKPRSRNKDWQQITSITASDASGVWFAVNDGPDRMRWRMQPAEPVQRSLVKLEAPMPHRLQAKAVLHQRWPTSSFKVITIRNGVSARWTDGPSYDDVYAALHDQGLERLRLQRTLSGPFVAACAIRAARTAGATSAHLPLVAEAMTDRSSTDLTDGELAMGEVLAAISKNPDVSTALQTLEQVGLETLTGILSPLTPQAAHTYR